VHKIKECFLDSLYYFLDGMVHLALSGEEPLLGEDAAQNHGVDWRDRVSIDDMPQDDGLLTIWSPCRRIPASFLP
jgi:hypothetical protein